MGRRTVRRARGSGKKNDRGILESMATRREFLSDISHRIRFVYLPKHSSWLNQIEIIFGIIQRKFLRGGNFTSVKDLESQIRAVHHLLQHDDGPPLRLDLHRKAVQKTRRPHSSRPIAASNCKECQTAKTCHLMKLCFRVVELDRFTVGLRTRRRPKRNHPLIRPSGTFSPRGEGDGFSTSPLGERSAEGRVRGSARVPANRDAL